ncbi:hypothetical protein BU26DRAFT_559000 [Trematosphaeria pertusa]|uniref:Uncharacterized protein n=1 Tax=Trematosphaeria pertusa TaxID=390896 RepID=A0A6A6IV36_9PLEO|nr:uncharacterized protein BU26DRAFT_559000 [Trematosphaeria pertusa]KAF2254304.1 hypothetical protein BU26DRAFT_559000 [Trematosphaeria pertusa]
MNLSSDTARTDTLHTWYNPMTDLYHGEGRFNLNAAANFIKKKIKFATKPKIRTYTAPEDEDTSPSALPDAESDPRLTVLANARRLRHSVNIWIDCLIKETGQGDTPTLPPALSISEKIPSYISPTALDDLSDQRIRGTFVTHKTTESRLRNSSTKPNLRLSVCTSCTPAFFTSCAQLCNHTRPRPGTRIIKVQAVERRLRVHKATHFRSLICRWAEPEHFVQGMEADHHQQQHTDPVVSTPGSNLSQGSRLDQLMLPPLPLQQQQTDDAANLSWITLQRYTDSLGVLDDDILADAPLR